MDLNDLTILEILRAVDSMELDPLLAINEEKYGRNRKTLIAALESRIVDDIVPDTITLPDEDETVILPDEGEDPSIKITEPEADRPLPPELYVSSRGIIECRLKSDSPAKVKFSGNINCTLKKRKRPYAVPREYWLAVLKRTDLFEEIKR